MKHKIFKKNDYNHGDGMLTKVWGPSLWHSLHVISFNYPVDPTNDDKTHYKELILNLQYILPCKHCRKNVAENFKKMPLTMDHMKSRDTFSRYVYDLHELVNKMLKKKSNLSFCDVRERYEHFRARCTSTSSSTLKKNNHAKGCTEPLFGKKAKCLLRIVPDSFKAKTMKIHNQCLKKRH